MHKILRSIWRQYFPAWKWNEYHGWLRISSMLFLITFVFDWKWSYMTIVGYNREIWNIGNSSHSWIVLRNFSYQATIKRNSFDTGRFYHLKCNWFTYWVKVKKRILKESLFECHWKYAIITQMKVFFWRHNVKCCVTRALLLLPYHRGIGIFLNLYTWMCVGVLLFSVIPSFSGHSGVLMRIQWVLYMRERTSRN